MRPLTARSALEGTQPLFTHVPPITSPSMMAVFRPCHDKNELFILQTNKRHIHFNFIVTTGRVGT